MFRFSSPRLLWWWVGRSVGIKKKKKRKKCKHLKGGRGSREGRAAK